jgi:hypothetical protein
MADKKLSDEEILKMIEEFESLPEDARNSLKLGSGQYKETFSLPNSEYVIKTPRVSRSGAFLPNPEKDRQHFIEEYINSKKMQKHYPVEQPMLVNRPDKTPILVQKKLQGSNDNLDYDLATPQDVARETEILKSSQAMNKELNDRGLMYADIHDMNIGLDNEGKAKIFDVGSFEPRSDIISNANNTARSTAIQKIAGNLNPKIYRSVVGALPLAGTALALSSGDVSAAAEELPSEIPILGQAYDALRSEAAGNSQDDREIINEVNARKSYDNSPAGQNSKQNPALRRQALQKLMDR